MSELKCGDRLRVTKAEIERCRRLGLELGHVRSRRELSEALVHWLRLVAVARPEVLERIYEAVLRDPVLRAKLPNAEVVPFPSRDEVSRNG